MTDVQQSYDVSIDVGIQPRSYEHVRVEIKRTGIELGGIDAALQEMGGLVRQALLAGEGARQSLFQPDPPRHAELYMKSGDHQPVEGPPPVGERFTLGE